MKERMASPADRLAANKPPRKQLGSKRDPQRRVWKCLLRDARLAAFYGRTVEELWPELADRE